MMYIVDVLVMDSACLDKDLSQIQKGHQATRTVPFTPPYVPGVIPQPGTLCAWSHSPVGYGMCLQAHTNIDIIIHKDESTVKSGKEVKETKQINSQYRRRIVRHG